MLIAHRADRAAVASGPVDGWRATARQFTRAGHAVTVFERGDRHGIPEYGRGKSLIDRRVRQMGSEETHVEADHDLGVELTLSATARRRDWWDRLPTTGMKHHHRTGAITVLGRKIRYAAARENRLLSAPRLVENARTLAGL